MELKDYQADVLDDLSSYLQTLLDCEGHLGTSFSHYWRERGVFNQEYKDTVQGVPHVCLKVPTAGGKTFIAVNALERVFSAFEQCHPSRPKFVVWLVPSLTILEQTVKCLGQSDHPYRQRLNDLFQGRVHIVEKRDVLQGAGFNADSVRAQLSIVVMSFDSLKATNKENRKSYQENSYLASFLQDPASAGDVLKEYDPSALINVIRTLKPVVVVDESHNAESILSVDMLKNLNPSFILDLTATPRAHSNIISYVDALRLKKQHMVKLPVIVANERNKESVIMTALMMRRQLEVWADKDEAQGGPYIRPIVLFQAEPKSRDDTTTFNMVKQTLLDLAIPAEHIAIKTANVNELKGVNLLARDCPVRYIITVNALKEGWDCPFAYVLATLANKSSVIDVTQILGRVLRMPHQRAHRTDMLNLSYVFTASNTFQTTLNQVVAGLNHAGFSQRDYRELDLSTLPGVSSASASTPQQGDLLIAANSGYATPLTQDWAMDHSQLSPQWEATATLQTEGSPLGALALSVESVKRQAIQASQEFAARAAQSADHTCPDELKADMNEHKIKPMFAATAQALNLPQFFVHVPSDGGFFADSGAWQLLAKENLLKDFVLASRDAHINFAALDSSVYAVDAEDIGHGESAPAFRALKAAERAKLYQVIQNQTPSGQVKSIVARLLTLIGKSTFYPIDDKDIQKYLTRIVEDFPPEQRADCLERDYAYGHLEKPAPYLSR